jgi:hypothetical protein
VFKTYESSSHFLKAVPDGVNRTPNNQPNDLTVNKPGPSSIRSKHISEIQSVTRVKSEEIVRYANTEMTYIAGSNSQEFGLSSKN